MDICSDWQGLPLKLILGNGEQVLHEMTSHFFTFASWFFLCPPQQRSPSSKNSLKGHMTKPDQLVPLYLIEKGFLVSHKGGCHTKSMALHSTYDNWSRLIKHVFFDAWILLKQLVSRVHSSHLYSRKESTKALSGLGSMHCCAWFCPAWPLPLSRSWYRCLQWNCYLWKG